MAMLRLNFRGAGVALSADRAGGLFEGCFRGALGAVAVACLAQALTVGAVARGTSVATAAPVEPPAGIHQGCFEYGIPRSLITTKLRGNGEYWRGQAAPPTWLRPPGQAVAAGSSRAIATGSTTAGPVGTPGPHGSSFLAYGRGYSKTNLVSPLSWEFFRGRMAVVGLKHYTKVLGFGAATSSGTATGVATARSFVAGALAGTSTITGVAVRKVFPAGTTAGSGTAAGVARVLAVASGAQAGSSAITGNATRLVLPIGTLAGVGGITGAAHFWAVGTGTATGAGAITGVATRRVFPSGATAGTSEIAGVAIRRVLPTGTLAGAGDTEGLAKRIVWTVGTLTGCASLVEGVPTTRIFAPAWGNSSLTGDTEVSYVGQAAAFSPAVVTGLGGYALVASGETLAGTSGAFSIQGANLKACAAVGGGTSDSVGDANERVAGASEADGACDVHADTCVVFLADGAVLAGDAFDLDGGPQASATLASAGAITHAEASALGGSRVQGSAPTPVASSGTITGGSDILYVEVVIYDLEELDGISSTDASAGLAMTVGALSVNLSYPVATANYDPVLMAGAVVGAGAARGLATVAWNERPPR